MRYYTLGSGSSGNATLIICDDKLIMIDMGLSNNDIRNKLSLLGYSLNQVDYFLFTHEHIDHIRSAEYTNPEKRFSPLGVVALPIENILIPFNEYYLQDIKITVLPLSHDANTTVGFIIEYKEEKLVYITDTGYLNQKIMNYIINADYYLFESNHDVKMLMDSSRPYYLKQRILSDKGHLSNEEAAYYLLQSIGNKTKEVMLLHLSDIANDEEHAIQALHFEADKKGISLNNILIQCAKRYEITSFKVKHGN